MSRASKRPYVREKPHNKITPAMIKQMKAMVKSGTPKYRIAMALGIHRSHLYRLMDQYCG
jgi:hypothetical protein